ncbi:hypothetical protein EDD85DRAFT_772040, partial [Armillaria nabsnona]
TDSYFLVTQCVLYAEPQWGAALSEIYHVLALGGWVQIIEGLTILTHVGPYSERIGSILGKMYLHKGLFIDVAKHVGMRGIYQCAQ